MSINEDKALDAIREAAHEWAARLETEQLSHADKSAFAAWLRASPIHLREYLKVEALRLAVKGALEGDTTDPLELLSDAPTNVIELRQDVDAEPSLDLSPESGFSEATEVAGEPTRTPMIPSDADSGSMRAHTTQSLPSRRPERKRVWLSISAAAMVLLSVGGVLALMFWNVLDPGPYTTGVGEFRRIQLPDGSAMELNTLSSVRVDFDSTRRDVYLEEGEVFFNVAKDAHRPFRVFSDKAQIQAIGTQFSVYRKHEQTVVTVVEGKVAALPIAASAMSKNSLLSKLRDEAGAEISAMNDADVPPNDAIVLTAGHQVVIAAESGAASTMPEPALVDAKRVTAWRQHRLIFDNEPLANVIAEFNRYNRQHLIVEDHELAARGISGVFDPEKPETLVLFLERKGGVKTIELSNEALLLTP